jgi:tetratricopeptide (TPR) repeat protein
MKNGKRNLFALALTIAWGMPVAWARGETDYFQLATLAGERGEDAKSIELCSAAIERDPEDVLALFVRANLVAQGGDFEKAITDYTEVIRLHPGFDDAYYRRGLIHQVQNRSEEALADYSEALRLNPDFQLAYANRSDVLGELGRHEAAIADLGEVIRLEPTFAQAYSNRGLSYQDRGDLVRALADFSDAIRLEAESASGESYANRGRVHDKLNDFEGAIGDYEMAIRLEPNLISIHNSLAWIRATCPEAVFRDGKKAVEHATTACELLDWSEPACLDTLASAYATQGDFSRAVEWEEKAIELMDEKEVGLEEFRERLVLFRASKPYYENVEPSGKDP